MEVIYKVSDLKNLIAESSNEFKAKLGPDVESKDKEINGKAYKDAKTRAKEYDGGLAKEEDWARGNAKYEKNDYNRTTIDYEPENATSEYQKRVHAQVKGYSSEQEMNNGIEKAGDFSDNDKFYKAVKKSGEEIHADKVADCKKGLVGRTRDDKYFEKSDMYESKKPVSVGHFKKTVFMSEAHMISRIPDDFKKDGNIFKMRDANDSEYLVEWKYNKATILEHTNKKGAEESLKRMKQLMEYKTEDSKTNNSIRINENDEKFSEILNKMRRIL